MAFLAEDATFAEIQTAVKANADYDLAGGSLEKGRQFIQACRMYLVALVDETQRGSSRVREDPAKIREMLKAAESWVRSRDTTGAMVKSPGLVRKFSLRNYRY